MSFVPPFLQALGLADDADERAIRRAYARQLKQIDQATEIEAFQALRAAYELALAAVQRVGPVEAAIAPAPVAPPTAVDIPASTEADVDDFAVRLASLSSAADAAALLQHILARLTSLEAGTRFERQVAELLARGWRPGHEFLLEAASDTFHWAQDRRHLLTHGEAGLLLQEALIQQQVFLGQSAELLDRQQRLVRRLRDATPPSRTLQRDEKPLLQVLVRRFPHWLPMVTPVANIEHWLGGPQALQAALAMPKPSPQLEESDGKFAIGRLILFLLWLAFMAWRHFG